MLVEINFIEKKKKSIWNFWFFLTQIAFFTAIFSWLLYQYYDLGNKQDLLNEQIRMERELRTVLEQNSQNTNQQLEAIEIIKKYPISVTTLFSQITETLPNGANIKQVSLNSTKELVIGIQTNDKPSVAKYVKTLKSLPMFEQVSLTDITSSTQGDDKKEVYQSLIQLQLNRSALTKTGEANE
jgi:Fimbrial assembly protein (PilN)